MAKKMKASDELRIGVLGAGGRGWLASLAHKPGEGSRVVALCDIRKEAFKGWENTRKKEDNAPKMFCCSDYRRVIERDDIDAVFITTPDYCHEEMALAAIEAGKAVYLEKPMAITIEGCDKILRAAKENKARLFVGHNMRHMAFVTTMKRLIDEGAIGNLQTVWCRHFINYGGDAYFKDWHSEQKNTTGLLLQKGAHDIDVIHWLAGGYTKRVIGMGKLSVYNRCKNRRSPDELGCARFDDKHWPPLSQTGISPVINVEDSSTIMMQLDNGVTANYMQCQYTPDACRNYTFIGDEGRIENITETKIAISRSRHGWGEQDEIVRVINGYDLHGGADPLIVDSFIKYAKGLTGAGVNSPLAARYSVATGVMGTRSIREDNMPFEIPPVDPDILKYFSK